jgi:pSer/pThr/pTyr-binding forkhead associated (FHA) protein
MQRYPLKEKDIIKFGKQKVKVREIVLNEITSPSTNDFSSFKTNKKIYDDLKLKEADQQLPKGKEHLVQEVLSVAT